MPKKKVVDEAKLLKMVDGRENQKDIMETFGFKTATQLKVAYTEALMSSGRVPTISGGRGKKEKEPTATVNKRGSLVIPAKLVEQFNLKEGDAFEVRKTKVGLVFRSLEEAKKPAVKLRKKAGKSE